jgi:thiol-disulfide isomerase/thioredoxin
MDRATFINQSLCAVIAISMPAPSPSPSPTTSPDPWDQCEKSLALPYDRPLGLKMRVLDGPDFNLESFRGRPTIISVFASWCGPCNDEMPSLVEAAKTYADKKLAIVLINFQETDNTVRDFRKKYSINLPIAMDADGGFTQALEVGATSKDITLPNTLFISPLGYLYCLNRGSMDHDEMAYRLDKFIRDTAPIH